jgi:uncharacterized protein
MNIPSKKECFKLIKEMNMMDHIIDHSVMVSNVALFLSHKINAAGIDPPDILTAKPSDTMQSGKTISSRLATSAALLHDITKTRSFKTKEIHSETGGIMLTDLGYPEIGNIIRQHVILDFYNSDEPVTEQEIVNYSDKRILHDKIVSLQKRLEYIELRYGARKEFKYQIPIMYKNARDLEEKIFSHLDITPDQLSEHVINEIKKEDWT